jgi:targeting protein for Xklp2
MEAELMANMPSFKARPVNRAVLESSGDLGVPRVSRPKPTQPKEFMLSTAGRPKKDDDASSDAGSTASAPATYKFKARPYNKQLMEGKAAGLAQVTPRKTTRAVSPKLSTSNRAAVRPEPTGEAEPFAAFKARPMPDMANGPSPIKSPLHRPLTSPKPFNLDSMARHEVYSSQRERSLAAAAAAAAEATKFKARPMPVSDGWKPTIDGKHTEFSSFNLNTDARSEVHQEEFRERTAEAEAAAKRAANFKAKPAKVLGAPAFAPRKSTKPLTEIAEHNRVPFHHSIDRQEKRKQLDAQMAAKRAAMEAAAERKAKQDAIAAAKDIAALRAQMVPKARKATVLKTAPFVVRKPAASERALTQPSAPNLHTSDRSAVRNPAPVA